MTDKPKKRTRKKTSESSPTAASKAEPKAKAEVSAPEDASSQAAPARPDRESSGHLVPILVSVAASLAAVVALALIAGPSLVPDAPAPASDLDGRVARLEAQPSDTGAVSRSFESFAERLDAQDIAIRAATERLDTRLDALDGALARDRAAQEADSGRLRGEIERLAAANAQLGSTVDELTTALSQRADSQRDAGALLLAVGQLRAVAASGPFAGELDIARLLADRVPGLGAAFTAALDRLAPHAAAGATSPRLLRERFPAVARAVIHAEQAQGAEGWLDKAAAEIKQLVTVRRVGPDVSGDGAEAALARAESALAAGDVAGAVAALETLGPLTEAAQPWLDEARAQRDIAAALDDLISLAIAASGRGDG